MKNFDANYVLITPARNEGKYIGKTLKSVVSQSILPIKYIVISDGSTDETDSIVADYAKQHSFIELIRRVPDQSRNFGSKVYAIKEGLSRVENIDYDYIGFMDADVSFDHDFMQQVLQKLHVCPKIGICGGLVYEKNGGHWKPFKTQILYSVSGAMQMFRRKCYEDIGGYLPLKRGGIEMVVEVMARMNGWHVRTLENVMLRHHKPMGKAQNSLLAARFKRGQMEYVNGYHPFFQLVRFFLQITTQPFLIDTTARTAGYLSAMLMKEPFAVPKDFVTYIRREQMQRLFSQINLLKGSVAKLSKG